MKADILKEMLFIDEPSVLKLYKEVLDIASRFVAPAFLIAICLEYFGQMNFSEVIKKLFVAVITLSVFYQIHTEAVKLSFEGAGAMIQKVNPNNLFLKKWYQQKVEAPKSEIQSQKGWGFIKSIALPNLNDLVAIAFFWFAKLFIWFLKLIFSTVYHLTYVFAPVTAILYFFGWTNNSLKGSVQASLWCMLMPFVVASILIIVGNTMASHAANGELAVASVDTLVWLCGVTLLLLISPIITLGLVRGDGVHGLGTQIGVLTIGAGMKAGAAISAMASLPNSSRYAFMKASKFGSSMKEKMGFRSDQKKSDSSKFRDQKSDKSQNQSSREVERKNESDKQKVDLSKSSNSSNSNKTSTNQKSDSKTDRNSESRPLLKERFTPMSFSQKQFSDRPQQKNLWPSNDKKEVRHERTKSGIERRSTETRNKTTERPSRGISGKQNERPNDLRRI